MALECALGIFGQLHEGLKRLHALNVKVINKINKQLNLFIVIR